NGTETGYLNRLALEEDQVSRFMKLVDDVIEIDEHAGNFLKYKYLDENTIQEIADRLKVSRRTVYNIMPRAYFYVAEWSHNVVFVIQKTYSFQLKIQNLYDKLS
ncbi:HTH domain-containing protein, partial [Lactobacillus intestinalis]|uniref:HTH domain-containing protein n=1 Tax=Lactobacillus intestinalis TaxID=151781 RepID=UPI0025A21670